MFRKILFAHDGTPAAERALVYLEHVARQEEAEVLVLHVYEPPERYVATHGFERLIEQFETVASEVVTDTVEYLQQAGVSAIGMVESGASPAQTILETAADEDVSLIVLGTRGPRKVADLVVGHVSMEVLRHARCPVFLVP
ncbi:MAG: universal stress protein [Anaerolineae bacterium]